jgi:hypothetical protein
MDEILVSDREIDFDGATSERSRVSAVCLALRNNEESLCDGRFILSAGGGLVGWEFSCLHYLLSEGDG